MSAEAITMELSRRVARWKWTEVAVAVAGFGLSIVPVALRLGWFWSVLISMAAAVFIIASWMLKAQPLHKYRQFRKEMEEGLRNEAVGTVVSLGEDRVLSQGVLFYPLTLREEEPDAAEEEQEPHERLVYVDAQQPRPEVPPGQRVRLTLFGNYLVRLEPEGEAT